MPHCDCNVDRSTRKPFGLASGENRTWRVLRTPTPHTRRGAASRLQIRWVLKSNFYHSPYLLLLLRSARLIAFFSRTTWVSRYLKGKTSLDLNEARDDGVLGWQWHQLNHMQTICTLLQTDNHTNTSSLNFYRPYALPDAQPTVSKHWRHSVKALSLFTTLLDFIQNHCLRCC